MTNSEEGSLERIRRVRHEISEEFGHDPRRLVQYYIELQNSHADRLLETVAPTEESTTAPHNPAVQPTGSARG
jgi:hypothetical protein